MKLRNLVGILAVGLTLVTLGAQSANAASLSIESGAGWQNKTGLPKNGKNNGHGLVLTSPGVVRVYGFDGAPSTSLTYLAFEGLNNGSWVPGPSWVIYLSDGTIVNLPHYLGTFATGSDADWLLVSFYNVPGYIAAFSGVDPSSVTIQKVYLTYSGSGLVLDNIRVNNQIFGGPGNSQ